MTGGLGGKPLEEIFSERLKFEHDLIGHRMTWLMTLNSFLVGAIAVLVANTDKLGGGYLLGGGLAAIAVLGTLSNASCLFSNFWATRAVREAGEALASSWAELEPEAQETRRLRMRLYGRDPRAFVPAKAPPSQALHPWLFLPGLFLVFFLLVPFVAPHLSTQDRDVPLYLSTGALVVGLIPFLALPLLDVRRNQH